MGGDSDFGNVRRRIVPDLEIGPDGQPTPESWKKLMDALDKIGHGTKARTLCDTKADADKININKFAEQRMHDPNREPYGWSPSERISESHPSLDAARSSGTLERGWIPEALPADTRDIALEYDLDSNEVWGVLHRTGAYRPG